MSTSVHVGLNCKALCQDSEQVGGKTTWRLAAQPSAKAGRDDTFYTIPLLHGVRRVLLAAPSTARGTVVVVVTNPDSLHTIRISNRTRKGKVWADAGMSRYIGPKGSAEVVIDSNSGAIVEEMPS